MASLASLKFQLMYLGRPPWDSGVSPPELFEYIRTQPAGRGIDLGCGTGTNAIALAKAGWQVTAVDFARLAVQKARAKARAAGVQIKFVVGDITGLRSIGAPYDLGLDVGCFHAVHDRAAYLDRLTALLRPGGCWLLYGFHKPSPRTTGPGLTAADLEAAAARLQLRWRQDGVDKRQRPSSWFLFQKPDDT